MTRWTPNPKLARALRNVCFLCWVLCLAAAVPFVGATDDKKPGIEVILFVGVFPLFLGAVLILQKRMAGVHTTNWVPVLFRGVPKGFVSFFQVFFFAVWLVCFYLMMRQLLQKPEWPAFGVNAQIGLVLIPSVFYLTSAGAYWSAAIENTEMNPGQHAANGASRRG